MKTINRALIDGEWFEVLELNPGTRKVKVQDQDGKLHMFDTKDVTVFTKDYKASDTKPDIKSGKKDSINKIRITRVIPKNR